MKPRAAIILAVCVAVLALAWWVDHRRPTPRPPDGSLGDVSGDLAAGRPEAFQRVKAAAARDWPGSLPSVVGMLAADNWRLRAVACEIVSARQDGNLLPLLISRASDADWHVRAVAFDALGRIRPFAGPAPMANTPLAQREETLLAWVEAEDARSAADAESAQPLAGELCEIYANDAHVEFGRPLTDRCLRCHAGTQPQPYEAAGACEQCHPAIHRQWGGSAHANSLTHLHLITVDPNTRSPQVVDFGAVKGIGCTECHRLDGPGQVVATSPAPAAEASAMPGSAPVAGSALASASRPAGCPYRFAAAQPAGDSCRRCHASADVQWRSWQSRPHPVRLDWPPGQIGVQAGGDRRTCVDCHMRPRGPEASQETKDHAWAARRDPAFLREGVELRVSSAGAKAGGPAAQITLMNLAGHDYPTGSRRRGIRLYAGAEDAPQGPPLATLSPRRPGQLFQGAQPALAPGESRTLGVELPAAATRVKYQLRYLRDLGDPNGYSADVLSGLEPINR
jgi:hypothetical protein